MSTAAYEHNGAPRRRASASTPSPAIRAARVAVEACAGAGKTWMLVSRILRACWTARRLRAARDPGDHLHQEGGRRDARAAATNGSSDFAGAPLTELVPELVMRGMAPPAAEAARAAAAGSVSRAAGTGRPVQIRTFHAWFAGLLRSAPLAVLEQPAAARQLRAARGRRRGARARLAALLRRRGRRRRGARPTIDALVATHGRSQTAKALDDALDAARRVRAGRRARRGRRSR